MERPAPYVATPETIQEREQLMAQEFQKVLDLIDSFGRHPARAFRRLVVGRYRQGRMVRRR